MIRLDGLEIERSKVACRINERKTAVRVDTKRWNRVCPSGMNIEQGVYIQPLARRSNVNRVDFNEDAWFLGNRPRRVRMPFLPEAGICELVSLEGSFHRGERYRNTLFCKQVMDEEGVALIFLAIHEDRIDDGLIKFLRMNRT